MVSPGPETKVCFQSEDSQDSLVIVLMHYQSVEMSIYEIGFFKTSSASHDFTRLEVLHSCLKTVQGFFANFLSQPVSVITSLSLFTFTQLAHAVVILHKLSTFEHPDWDLEYVRATLDFGDVIGQLITWFDSVKEFEKYWIGGLDSCIADGEKDAPDQSMVRTEDEPEDESEDEFQFIVTRIVLNDAGCG